MQEIGGYIELDRYTLPMLHEKVIKLNCGRNALAYLIETKQIKRILMPKFMCDSCNGVFRKYGVSVRYYSIDLSFKPINIDLQTNEWLYVVNFYGQLSNEYIKELKSTYTNVIIDQAQAYFQMPIESIDTLYTCRKFFGVADGAILYTDEILDRELPQDESFERMHFLMGRFERTASEFYSEYIKNNEFFESEPIKYMSKLTENLLHGIDYSFVKNRRTENFNILHNSLKKINKLSELIIPEGAFMYPLYVENGNVIRKRLQKEKIYIPILWPAVFDICDENDLEYDMARNILPIPVDQRYDEDDVNLILNEIFKHVR
jgi:hypothetical protein